MAHQWLQKVQQHAQTALHVAGALHTGYQVGKALYGLAQAAAPFAAALL
jgi:glutamate synthase domain-containing protein 2